MQLNRLNHSKNWQAVVVVIASLVLGVVAGFRPIGFDRDSTVYAASLTTYFQTGEMDFSKFEPAFWLVAMLGRLLSSDGIRFVLIAFAVLGVCLKSKSILGLSSYPLLSLFIYACYLYPLHELTQIRVGVATGIFLFSLRSLLERRLAKYAFLNFIAVLFHYSLLAAYLVLLFNPKKFSKTLLVLLPLVSLLVAYFISATGAISLLGFYFPKIETYVEANGAGEFQAISIPTLSQAALIAMYYLIVFKIDRRWSGLDLLLSKIYCMGVCFLLALSSLPVLAIREFEVLSVASLLFFSNGVRYFRHKKVLIFGIVVLHLSIAVKVFIIEKYFDLEAAILQLK